MVDLPAPEGPDMTIGRLELVGAMVEAVVRARGKNGLLNAARARGGVTLVEAWLATVQRDSFKLLTSTAELRMDINATTVKLWDAAGGATCDWRRSSGSVVCCVCTAGGLVGQVLARLRVGPDITEPSIDVCAAPSFAHCLHPTNALTAPCAFDG